jgi:predicted metal-dependent hydrolase
LFNERNFYAGHDEWEEVWRRDSGARRRLLHGLIQVAVGYEHLRRGNPRGMRSLLRQGATKLARFTRRPGVRELRERALADAERAATEPDISFRSCPPPKILVGLEGHSARLPAKAIEIRLPPR